MAGVALADLPSRGCRFAVGSSARRGHLFCGQPAAEGKPYCADHAARAYRPLPPKAKGKTGGEAALDALARARGDRAVGYGVRGR